MKHINPDLSVAEALRDALHVARLATDVRYIRADLYDAQAAEIAALRERVAKFEDHYRHYHKADYITRGDDYFLTDDCVHCPFDLRDPVHIGSQHD